MCRKLEADILSSKKRLQELTDQRHTLKKGREESVSLCFIPSCSLIDQFYCSNCAIISLILDKDEREGALSQLKEIEQKHSELKVIPM